VIIKLREVVFFEDIF